MEFAKYHALGNDYVVIEPAHAPNLTPEQVRLICHRNYGLGADGVLWGPTAAPEPPFGLRIFNPDGSEAEKSGNGLRIFARHLYDRRLVQDEPFSITTLGGKVRARVHPGGGVVTVEMGAVSFDSARIPVAGPPREVLNEELTVGGQTLTFSAATIGNPHCVILCDDPTPAMARSLGPLVENDPRFPNRTNVQFMKVLDRDDIRIEIWERGAGYTLASGSSSCAAAAVAHRLGVCDSNLRVHMPGGQLEVSIGPGYALTQTGPVTPVAHGSLSPELLSEDSPAT